MVAEGALDRCSSGSTYPSRITSACAGTSMSIVPAADELHRLLPQKPENIISSMSSERREAA